jgi:hypothetical protein
MQFIREREREQEQIGAHMKVKIGPKPDGRG